MSFICLISYLAAHLTLVGQFFFLVHYLNVVCKMLHFLLIVVYENDDKM